MRQETYHGKTFLQKLFSTSRTFSTRKALTRIDVRGYTQSIWNQLFDFRDLKTIELFVSDFQEVSDFKLSASEEVALRHVAALERIIQDADKKNAVACYFLALYLLSIPSLSNPVRARKLLEESIEMAPRFANAKTLLGILLMKGDKGITVQPEKARTLFEESVAIAPDYALAHLKLGELLLQKGDENEQSQYHLDQVKALGWKEKNFFLLLDRAKELTGTRSYSCSLPSP